MRAAMAAAEVGDDVYGEDPTVNRLEERSAEIFEKEAALFVASGTMGNQLAIKVLTRPGEEVIVEQRSHVFNFELGMAAILSGVTFRDIRSADAGGKLSWQECLSAYRPGNGHESRTGLICLENTHNMGGGSVMSADDCREICESAHELGVSVHIDGARVFNAAVATGSTVADLTRNADSVQFCLSKGLAAPVGSMLVGSRAFIDEARLWRKRLGGGIRQAGVIAAAGLVAIEKSPSRLSDDHSNARALAEGLAEIPGIRIDPEKVVTNIVNFDISASGMSTEVICDRLKNSGVLCGGWYGTIRMVTHQDVSSEDVRSALRSVRHVFG